VSYTWSKALTDNSSDRSNSPQNYYARNLEYARATFDRTHVLTASYIYEIPLFRHSAPVLKNTLGGWQVSGIATFQSGLPVGVTSGLGLDWGGLGILGSSASSPRPDLVADPNAGAPHTMAQWFNGSAFAAVAPGLVRPGNASPRVVNGPGLQRWDISLMKNFRVSERYRLQLRGEAFNAFNHTNWGSPGGSLGATTYNVISSAREPRRIQLAARFSF